MEFLTTLEQVIDARLAAGDDDNSYTASLARAGMSRIAQKIGEEGVELALAAATDRDQDELLGEAADLFYHVLVMLRVKSLSVADVTKVLEARHAGAR
ncbi:MAG: phosphoribosyl-ATP diphosphatase [Pseudomonadota bacterium]